MFVISGLDTHLAGKAKSIPGLPRLSMRLYQIDTSVAREP